MSVILNGSTGLVTNATGVKLSSFGDQVFPVDGSQSFTYQNTETYSETITAIGTNRNRSLVVKVAVIQ
jgi:hypothetical protein